MNPSELHERCRWEREEEARVRAELALAARQCVQVSRGQSGPSATSLRANSAQSGSNSFRASGRRSQNPFPPQDADLEAGNVEHGQDASVTRGEEGYELHPEQESEHRERASEREQERTRTLSPRTRLRARSPRRGPARLTSDGSCGNPRRRLESDLEGGGERLAREVEVAEAGAELALAASQHVQVHSAPIKTRARMRDKVKCIQEEREENEEEYVLPLTGYILDPIRASVVCEGPSSILKHVEWFVRSWAEFDLPTVRIKNKFAVEDSAQYDGYRDLMLSVLYTGHKGLRIIGEVQFHDRRMYDLKVKMHKLYKVKRATSANQIL